jgi:alginate O-acetyltransferase complex protein AlgI
MTILQIGILVMLALVAGRLPKGRQLAMLVISTFAVFWLQPAQPFTSLRFWLPVGTLGITVLGWALTSAPEVRSWSRNWPAAVVLTAAILVVALGRYFRLEVILVTATPPLALVAAVLLSLVGGASLLARWQSARRVWLLVGLAAILLIFIFLKTPALVFGATDYFARLRGGSAAGTLPPLSWLGFSYVAFRLLHTIRDRQSGRLPSVTLSEYVNYMIFFPAFTAGPIDRIERFVQDLRSPLPLANEDWVDAGTRLLVGLFKKFVVADLLAVISINDVLVSQVKSPGWMWVFLYAYAFRIYLDFGGYTDIAIGMGRLLGVRLPENFTAPYLKSNLTQFWNSWHITLTQWFRSYIFNPLTRALRSAERPAPVWLIILLAQIITMVLIGLWHGITLGFAAWGLWHGLGLFVHNRWSDFSRGRMPDWTQSTVGQTATKVIGVFLTFNFVALGWLFFNLSTPAVAWHAMLRLFGIA